MKLLKNNRWTKELTKFQEEILKQFLNEIKINKLYLFRAIVTLFVQHSKKEMKYGDFERDGFGVTISDASHIFDFARKILFGNSFTPKQYETMINYTTKYSQQLCLRIGCNNFIAFKDFPKIRENLKCGNDVLL